MRYEDFSFNHAVWQIAMPSIEVEHVIHSMQTRQWKMGHVLGHSRAW